MNKKALVLAVGLAFATPTISIAKALPSDLIGISLGEIQSKSYLNEPFKGIIPILFTDIDASKKLTVSLAPKSIFKKIGAEKLPILNTLHFHIGVKNNTPVIFIESTQAIQMPFLNFVLEINGPKGTIYQDYTTLLDPKRTTEINSSFNNNGTFEQSLTHQKTSLKSSISTPNPLIINSKTTHKVKPGDTLSQIAQALNAADVSLNKMIKAIHKRNPSAFIDNNINRLKAGSVLYIPSKKELKGSTFKKAAKKALNNKPSNFKKTKSNSYTIKQGDNLSTITRKLGHKGVSFTKMMKAIHTANPHAFSKNKINLLKVGKTLRIPTLEEIVPTPPPSKNVSIENNKNTEKNIENTKEFILDGFIIEKGDTLAKITKQIGYKNIPYSKMMRAIYLANPDAFEKNNITTLIEGSIIRLPSIAEIESMDKRTPIFKSKSKKVKPAATEVGSPEKITNKKLKQSSVEKNDVLYNLEKRVRELKRDLTKAHSNLSKLELSLAGKETLIAQQSKDLANLASTLELLNREESIKPPITSNTTSTIKESQNTQSVLSNISPKERVTETVSPDSKIEIIKSNIQTGKDDNSYLPQDIGLSLSTDFKSKLAEYSQYMSGKELLASILALLFGLALIRYRREIYAYTNISYDHPKYYPPFGEEEARELLKEKSISFQSTLVDPPSDIHQENKPVFSDEHIKECEDLADELIENLEIETTIHSDNTDWSELDKACDDYIEEYKENSSLEITDVSNNPIEGARSEPEEMTFELFEALAEGVTKKEHFSSLAEEDKLIYGLDDDQVMNIGSFDEKKPSHFNDFSTVSNLNKVQAR